MKRKGFTLIELVVVIALIAILAVTLAPRLRDQIAKAGDAKAIAVLGSLRTQSEVYFADNQKSVGSLTTTELEAELTGAKKAIDVLINGLDDSAKKLFAEGSQTGTVGDWVVTNNTVPVGGTRAKVGDPIVYGGTIEFAAITDIDVNFGLATDGSSSSTELTATAADSKDNLWSGY